MKNITLEELLGMKRSLSACLLLLDMIKELSEIDSENILARKNKLRLFQKLIEDYPELPFYKFIEMFQLVGNNLSDAEYQQLVTIAFKRRENEVEYNEETFK